MPSDRLRRLLDREAHDRGPAAGVGPHVEGRRVRVQRGQPHRGRRHPELARRDPGEGGVGSLSDLHRAFVQRDRSGVVDLHPRTRDLVVAAAVLDPATEADAAVRLRGVLLAPADLPGGPQKALGQVAVEGRLPRSKGFALPKEVPEPELHRVPAHLPGHDVHLGLVGPHHLGRAHAAEGARGDRVGIDGIGVRPEMGDAVGSGRPVAGLLGHPGTRVRVGPAVHVHQAFPRQQAALPIDSGAELDAHGRLAHRAGLLFEGEVQEHGTPCLARQGHGQGFELGVVLVAVGPAHQRHCQPHALLRQAEHLGQLLADDERVLGRGPYGDAVVAPLGQDQLRLHGVVGHLGELEGVLEDPFRGGEPVLDAALAAFVVEAHVGVLPGLVVHGGIAGVFRAVFAHGFVQGRGVGVQGRIQGQERRERLVLHADEPQRLGGRLRGLRGHRRHRVPFIADLVHGQHRDVLHQRAVVGGDVLQVRGREHRGHPGMGLCGRGVDGQDARVRVGAAQDPRMEHVRARQVRGVHRLPPHLGGAVEPALVRGPRRGRALPAQQLRGPPHRPDDGEVAGAAADVAVQRGLDLVL